MITNYKSYKKWHYLDVESLSRLLREITSNYDSDRYCMNCLYSFVQLKKKLNHMKMFMPEEDNKISKYNQDKKSLKASFITYADIESLLQKFFCVITVQKNLPR